MGSKLSIDKQVSKLEDLLELNTALLDIVKYESNIPDCITQHLKVTHAPQNPLDMEVPRGPQPPRPLRTHQPIPNPAERLQLPLHRMLPGSPRLQKGPRRYSPPSLL